MNRSNRFLPELSEESAKTHRDQPVLIWRNFGTGSCFFGSQKMRHGFLFGEVGSADTATNHMILKKLRQRPFTVNYLRTVKKNSRFFRFYFSLKALCTYYQCNHSNSDEYFPKPVDLIHRIHNRALKWKVFGSILLISDPCRRHVSIINSIVCLHEGRFIKRS